MDTITTADGTKLYSVVCQIRSGPLACPVRRAAGRRTLLVWSGAWVGVRRRVRRRALVDLTAFQGRKRTRMHDAGMATGIARRGAGRGARLW